MLSLQSWAVGGIPSVSKYLVKHLQVSRIILGRKDSKMKSSRHLLSSGQIGKKSNKSND